jgi:DNA-directed RNA polymerase subunit beta
MAKDYIANKRKLKIGDKWPSPWDKGIVARIVREETCPLWKTELCRHSVESIRLPSRMNIGQIYETILGWQGKI